jgi:aminoglycoside 6-adenylyltransferase
VAKGLVRNEIIYSKEMLEMVVRPMFMNIVAWYIGIETNFSVSVGKGGKFMKDFLPPDLYKKILQTYSDQESENNWKALFLIMDVFGRLARTVSHKLKFRYIIAEEQNVVTYVSQLYKEQSPNKE